MKTQEKILRWTKLRKAAILSQIDAHPKQASKIMALHDLSPEELTEWRKALSSHGVDGLRTTRLQHYQPSRIRQSPSNYVHLKAPIK